MSSSLRPHGLYSPCNSRARILEWIAFPFSGGSSQPRSPALQVDSLPAESHSKEALIMPSSLFNVGNFSYCLSFSFLPSLDIMKYHYSPLLCKIRPSLYSFPSYLLRKILILAQVQLDSNSMCLSNNLNMTGEKHIRINLTYLILVQFCQPPSMYYSWNQFFTLRKDYFTSFPCSLMFQYSPHSFSADISTITFNL